MYVVLVTNALSGETAVYGPYRSHVKAQALCDLFNDPWSADFKSPEDYNVSVSELRKYQD